MDKEDPLTPPGQVLEWIGYNAIQVQVLDEALGDLPTMDTATRAEIVDVFKTYA